MQNIANVSIIFILIFLAHPIGHASQIYKWVDEHGKVHFGDRPNAELKQQEVQLKPLNTMDGPSGERRRKQQKLLESYQHRRDEKAKANEEKRIKQAETDKKCAQMRNALKRYLRSPALFEKLPDGKKRYLARKERDAETARLKRAINKQCR